MPQSPVACPLAEADLCDEPRLDPRHVALAHFVGERRVLAAQRGELLPEVAQRGARETGADLAGVAQPAALVVADQQRAELGARAARRRVAADDELLLGAALELQPVARAAVDVGRIGALGDQPLPLLAARLAEQRFAVAVTVRGEADRAVERERRPQERLALAKRQRGDIAAAAV